jgi:hypothetical protein
MHLSNKWWFFASKKGGFVMYCPQTVQEKNPKLTFWEKFKNAFDGAKLGWLSTNDVQVTKPDYKRLLNDLLDMYRSDLIKLQGDRDLTEHAKGLRDFCKTVIADIETALLVDRVFKVRTIKS